MTKPLVIYHGPGCMDGAAAALAAWLRFGDEAEYRPAQHGDPAPTDDEIRGRDVYVLDFSYPRAELERMDVACDNNSGASEVHPAGRLVVVDHHKTAQADLAGLPFCTFDMGKSGAVLAWEYLVGSERDEYDPPELLRYIQDRDLWRWELPLSREISAALAASGALADFRKLRPFLDWDGQGDGSRTLRRMLQQDGAAILRAERQMVERIAATAEEVEIYYTDDGDYVHCLAACSTVLQSEVGEALALESARRGRDAVGVVYYKDGATGKWRVSLRSRDFDFDPIRPAPDVSAIAKAYGGGGHQRAAGFECDHLPWDMR